MYRHLKIQVLTLTLACLGLQAGNLKAQSPLDTSALIQNNRSIYALVVSVKDSVWYARSFNDTPENALLNNQSLTKNVMAVLIGIATDKGYIQSLDEKISLFFPALKSDPDPRKADITLRDVMNQASGLWHEDLRHLGKYLKLKNPSQYILSQPLVSAPGSELHYNNAASHLMSVILSKATGQSTLDFARKYLFEPLGILQTDWPKMRDGYYDGAGLLSLHLRTIDMNKIGRMMLQYGKFQGKQVVSEKWIDSLLKPQKTYPAPWELSDTRYGLTFYHTFYKGLPIIYGMGWGGQFLILIPELQATISVNQRVNNRKAVQQTALFMGRIFPMIVDWISSQESAD